MIDVVPSVPKCPIPARKAVPVAAGYRYLCRAERSNVSGKGTDVQLFEESGTGHTGGIYRLYASVRTAPSTPFTVYRLWGVSDFYMGENTFRFIFD